MAEKIGEVIDLVSSHGEDEVADFDAGSLRRSACSKSHDEDLVVHLRGIEAEPRSRRAILPAEPEQVAKDRLQDIDRDDHVEVDGTLRAGLLEVKRSDSEKVAAGADERSSAPIGMGRRREDRFVEHVFPVPRKLLLGEDARRYGVMAPARSCQDDPLAGLRGEGRPHREER